MKLRCPDCRKTFPYDPVNESWPDDCPLCGAFIGTDKDGNEVAMPAIRTARSKSSDALYRQIEQASEQRVEQAAQMAGVSKEDMAGLKVTNLNDARREGEIAAVPVVNEVTQFMEQTKLGGFQGVDASTFSAGVKSGPHPNAGAREAARTQRLLRGG